MLTSKRNSLAGFALGQLLLAFLSVSLIQGLRGASFFDDAFITFRYARNLSQGLGFTYNPGQPVLGTTSPLFALLLAGAAGLIGPDFIPSAAWLMAWIADALNVWLVFRITTYIFKDRFVGIGAAGVFLLQPLRLDVAGGGMETSLYLTFLLAMYERYLIAPRSLWTAVWAALAVWLRPDALIALAPVFLDWLLRDFKTALKAALLAGLIVLPWLGWATLYFGSPIPQSILSKGVASHQPLGTAAFFLLTFLSTGSVGPYSLYSPWLPGLGLLVILSTWASRRLYRAHAPAWVVGAYPLFYLVVMSVVNPPFHFAWYYPPLMPGITILWIAFIRPFFQSRPTLERLVLSFLGVLLVAVPAVWMTLFPNWPLARSREAGFWSACAAVEHIVQPGQVVLAPDIGILGWCLDDAYILDSNGLVSPGVGPYDQKISSRLLSEYRPDLVIALDQFVDPLLLNGAFSLQGYRPVWRGEVTITGVTQWLRIYAR